MGADCEVLLHIVLIDWKIIKGQEAAFQEYWKSVSTLKIALV